MITDFSSLISSDNGLFLHWIILVSLLLGGLGLPIPEDLPVLLGGIVIGRGVVSLSTMAAICYVGVVVADLMIYGIGYKLGNKLVTYGTRSPFLPSVTQDRVDRIREELRKRRFLCIFIGRHLFPIRSVTFLTAGALKVPFLEFLLTDLIAGLVSVAIMLSIGIYVGENITPETFSALGDELHTLAIVLTVLIVVSGLYFLYKRRLKQRN